MDEIFHRTQKILALPYKDRVAPALELYTRLLNMGFDARIARWRLKSCGLSAPLILAAIRMKH